MEILGSVKVGGTVQELKIGSEESEPVNPTVGRLWLNPVGQLRVCVVGGQTPAWRLLDNVDVDSLSSANALVLSDVFQISRLGVPLKSSISDVLALINRASVVQEITDATKNLTQSDNESFLSCNRSSGISITVEPQLTGNWAPNAQIEGCQTGSGAVTIVPGSGVTIIKHSSITNITDGVGSVFGLKRLASDLWLLFGQMAGA